VRLPQDEQPEDSTEQTPKGRLVLPTKVSKNLPHNNLPEKFSA
jgi:hypothetical protein